MSKRIEAKYNGSWFLHPDRPWIRSAAVYRSSSDTYWVVETSTKRTPIGKQITDFLDRYHEWVGREEFGDFVFVR